MNSHGARGPRGHYLTVECSAVVGVEHSPGGDQGSMVSARVGEPPVAGATAPARASISSSVDKVRRSPSLSDGPYAATPTRPQGSTELGTCSCKPGHRCQPCAFRARAHLRMYRLAQLDARCPDRVAYADQQTSMADARAALSLAMGYPPDAIGPLGHHSHKPVT